MLLADISYQFFFSLRAHPFKCLEDIMADADLHPFQAAIKYFKDLLKQRVQVIEPVSHSMEIKGHKFKSYATSGKRNDCLIFALLGVIVPNAYSFAGYDEAVNTFRRAYLPTILGEHGKKKVAGVTLNDSLKSKSYLGDELLDALAKIWQINFLVVSKKGRIVNYVIPKEGNSANELYYLILNLDGSHYEKLAYCSPDPKFMVRADIKNALCRIFYSSTEPVVGVVNKKIQEKEAEQVLVTIQPFQHDFTFLHTVFRKMNSWLDINKSAVLVEHRPLSVDDYKAYYRKYLSNLDEGKNIPTDFDNQDMYLLIEHLHDAETVWIGGVKVAVIQDPTAECIDLSSDNELNMGIVLSLFSPYQNNFRFDQQSQLARIIDDIPNLKRSAVLIKGADRVINTVSPTQEDFYLSGPTDPLGSLVWKINNGLPGMIPLGPLLLKGKEWHQETAAFVKMDFKSVFHSVYQKQVQWA